MKIITLTIILSLAISTPVFAIPQYSSETQKLMWEAGIEYNVPLDEVMRRQENYKKNKANKSTPSQDTVVKSTNNPYNEPTEKSGFDELRINENYRDQVWHPVDRGFRMQGFDELRYPDEM